MNNRHDSSRVRRLIAASTAALALAGLNGCGMSSLTSGLGGGMFGGSSAEPAQVSEADLLAAARDGPATGSTSAGSDVASGCPRVTIAPRGNNVTAYEPGRDGDGLAILHRGEIVKTARECVVEPGGRVTVRYGLSGRVLLGPKGQPGNVTLPLTIAVTDAKRDRLVTDQLAVDVAIGSDRPIGYFSAVRTLSFDVPEGARPGEFELVVGFSGGASG